MQALKRPVRDLWVLQATPETSATPTQDALPPADANVWRLREHKMAAQVMMGSLARPAVTGHTTPPLSPPPPSTLPSPDRPPHPADGKFRMSDDHLVDRHGPPLMPEEREMNTTRERNRRCKRKKKKRTSVLGCHTNRCREQSILW